MHRVSGSPSTMAIGRWGLFHWGTSNTDLWSRVTRSRGRCAERQLGGPSAAILFDRRACQAAALRSGAPAGSKESRGGARSRREGARALRGTDGTRAPESGRFGCAVTRVRPVRGGRTAAARARGPARAGDAHTPTRSSPVGPLASSEGRAPDGSGDRGSGVNDVRTGSTSFTSSDRLSGGAARGSATASPQCAEVRYPGAGRHPAGPTSAHTAPPRT